MSFDPFQIYLSSIDEERFGIRTARTPLITCDLFSSVMDFCRANDVALLIARCSTTDLQLTHKMESEGFMLMDTLVYFTRHLHKTPIPADTGRIPVRPLRVGDEESVKVVATEAFQGYFGHYHADERLDRVKCNEVYISWAYRSCISRDVADEVLVADLDGSIVGFATLKMNDAEEGEGILFGVASSAQGQGIYRSFMVHGMKWCLSKSAKSMIVSTQIQNIAVQKVWVRLGFEPSHSYYTFHKWFDE